MIAVTLMSVIVLGLTAMFTQVQRAFRLGLNQTDVLESGRVATDMIARELEQITPPYKFTNATPAFYSGLVDKANLSQLVLPGTSSLRTNVMSDLFFLTRENQTWTGIGYFVRTDAAVPGSFGPVGTLYRFETNASPARFNQNQFGIWDGYEHARNDGVALNVSKLLEGVVHFQVRAFDTNGIWITPGNTNVSFQVRADSSFWSPLLPAQANYFFATNQAPAYVELEIGILEQQIYERYKAIPLYDAQTNFLAKHAGNVHIFRQRIPIRNVDVTAYQ